MSQVQRLVERLGRWGLYPEVTVTPRFSVEQAREAYETFGTGRSGKVVRWDD